MALELREVLLNLIAAVPRVRDPLRRVRDRREPADHERVAARGLESLATRREFLGDERIRDATIVEIGSGKDACLGLLLLAIGARRVVNLDIDPYGFVADPALYRRLFELATAAGIPMQWPPIGLRPTRAAGVIEPDPERFALHLGRTAADIPEPDASVDVVLSLAVLEHVRPGHMLPVARELARITRPGGVGFHRIDLVDHYRRTTDPFRFLRYREHEYRWMYGNRGSSSNRFRMDDFERIFRTAGFSRIEFQDVRLYPDEARFAAWAESFDPAFRGRDARMMRACECMLVVTR
jgi:SAM-dependent methyltransferase